MAVILFTRVVQNVLKTSFVAIASYEMVSNLCSRTEQLHSCVLTKKQDMDQLNKSALYLKAQAPFNEPCEFIYG